MPTEQSGFVYLTLTPCWLARLLGAKVRTVWAYRGVGAFDRAGWFLPSGRACDSRMLDAIDALRIRADR